MTRILLAALLLITTPALVIDAEAQTNDGSCPVGYRWDDPSESCVACSNVAHNTDCCPPGMEWSFEAEACVDAGCGDPYPESPQTGCCPGGDSYYYGDPANCEEPCPPEWEETGDCTNCGSTNNTCEPDPCEPYPECTDTGGACQEYWDDAEERYVNSCCPDDPDGDCVITDPKCPHGGYPGTTWSLQGKKRTCCEPWDRLDPDGNGKYDTDDTTTLAVPDIPLPCKEIEDPDTHGDPRIDTKISLALIGVVIVVAVVIAWRRS